MPGEGGGYLRGLVTGALVGAATALLLAPKRGEDIRQDLADSAGRLKEKAEELNRPPFRYGARSQRTRLASG